MKDYKVIMHDKTVQKARLYLHDLLNENVSAGKYLKKHLDGVTVDKLSISEFLEKIVQTKSPQIYAESAVLGDGSDWNQKELSILGDISVAVPVTIFDNGLHYNPKIYHSPFEGTLLYTAGTLLRNDRGGVPADINEVTTLGQLDYDRFFTLYERRLLPLFIFASEDAKLRDQQALLTVPGLGCGMFSGVFKGQLGSLLCRVLIELLEKYGNIFTNIKALYYDPYNECNNQRLLINDINLLVRPLNQGNQNKPQLCPPSEYEETGDDFSDCHLYSLVAWDHVSWPGNDFYIGSRATDDGVKAAATNSMMKMTGTEGSYNSITNAYQPPDEYEDWKAVITKNKIQIEVCDNLLFYPSKF